MHYLLEDLHSAIEKTVYKIVKYFKSKIPKVDFSWIKSKNVSNLNITSEMKKSLTYLDDFLGLR
jgi:hypothetical protein